MDRSFGDSATTATGHATSPDSPSRCASSSTTARPFELIEATVSTRACRSASRALLLLTNWCSRRWPRTSPTRGSWTTTSPGQTVSRSPTSPWSRALRYWCTGSAWPLSRVCRRTNSTALTKSGNHGIRSPSIPHRRSSDQVRLVEDVSGLTTGAVRGNQLGVDQEVPLACPFRSYDRPSEDELLAAVDVVRRPRERRVRHQMNGQRGHVVRLDDAPDGQRRPEFGAPPVEIRAEYRRRERRVHEACRDQVDADRREVEGEIGDEGWLRDRSCRGDGQAGSWAAGARAAHEHQRARRPDSGDSGTRDLEDEQQAVAETAPRLLGRHLQRWPVVRTAGRDHHVVDRSGEVLEERLQEPRFADVERADPLRVELECCLLEALRITSDENDVGALAAGPSGGFAPDAGAAADNHDGLPDQLRLSTGDDGGGGGGHDLSPFRGGVPCRSAPRSCRRRTSPPTARRAVRCASHARRERLPHVASPRPDPRGTRTRSPRFRSVRAAAS